MLSKKEKYDLIVKLLKEGRTNREICKIVRCSPNEITPQFEKQYLVKIQIQV